MLHFPSDNDILDFAKAQRVGGPDAILRDLARIATILHLDDEGFFGDDTVLAGGTALRCYGGRRFTVTDVDTSTNADVKLGKLDEQLNWRLEDGRAVQLIVETDGVGEYKKGVELEKAQPIRFEPLFSNIPLTSKQAQFELTVNFRGVDLPPRSNGLRHNYPWSLGIEGRELPLMDPREMLAEKTIGYCVNLVAKHYADIAFLSLRFRNEMPGEKQKLRWLTNLKLERGREIASRGGQAGKALYAAVPNYAALRERLWDPERFLGISEFGPEVRFVLSSEGKGAIKLAVAKRIVRELLVPWLFDD